MYLSSGIPSANVRSVSDAASPLPNVRQTLVGWFRPITLGRISSRIVDGETKQTVTEVACSGMVQPFGSRELSLKPQGERAWRWIMLHTTSDIKLVTGENVIVRGTKCRVMSDQDFSEYGQITYELVQDYVGGQQ